MGPTASGKTSLAIELAKVLPIEIISVDSAQIYQGLDIGSGKPSLSVRNEIPHHLMDCLDPKIPYSAAQFRQDALKLIHDIRLRNKVPLLVGGTMLY
ncbi:MAG: tRNA (adenosine(37)-N6)-dimethylallyltransferase, partial [Candidatus Berkiella sp.]